MSALLAGIDRVSKQTTAAVESANASAAAVTNLTSLVEEVRANGSGGFPGEAKPDGSLRVQLAGVWWNISPTGKPQREA